jgi:hypothetical protein
LERSVILKRIPDTSGPNLYNFQYDELRMVTLLFYIVTYSSHVRKMVVYMGVVIIPSVAKMPQDIIRSNV